MLAGIAILAVAAVGIWQIRGEVGHTGTKLTRVEYMLQLTNAARISRGVPRVQLNAKANRLAKEHSRRMAAARQLFHSKPSHYNYRTWGENIGKGSGVYSLFKAFMHSSGHRAIILSAKYDLLGVGFVRAHGTLWVTMIFFRR